MPTTTRPSSNAAASSWSPVGEVCSHLCEEAARFAPRFAELIRARHPEYAAVPWEEHVEHVHGQCIRVLCAVAERRAPDVMDLELARQLGVRRASQGLAVETVIGAFQFGNRELWNMIRSDPVGLEPLLPEVGTIMWDAILVVTGALAAAHAEVSRALHADRVTLENRLLELLGTVAPEDSELLQVARVLGFDPGGTFQAVAANAVDVEPDRLRTLGRNIARLDGVVVYSARAARIVALGQSVPTDRLVGVFTGAETDGPGDLGVGLTRPGLTGAARSVGDALLALHASTHQGQVSRFEDHWLRALMMAKSDTLLALVEPQLPVVLANHALRRTVEVFAEQDLSVGRTAELMHLHPNSVIYRLNRWQKVTGWDPRSFDGLITSLLACWTAGQSTSLSRVQSLG